MSDATQSGLSPDCAAMCGNACHLAGCAKPLTCRREAGSFVLPCSWSGSRACTCSAVCICTGHSSWVSNIGDYMYSALHVGCWLQCRAAAPEIWCSRPDPSAAAEQQATQAAMQREWFARSQPLRTALVRQQVFFPDRRLIQFDCGKLQASAPQPAHYSPDDWSDHPKQHLLSRPSTVSQKRHKCSCHQQGGLAGHAHSFT